MNRVTARQLAVVLGAALALAGCTSTTNNEPNQQTTTTTTEPTTSASIREECVDVADKARAMLTEVGRLATGDSTVGQVRTAATELSGAFDDARAALGPEAQADLDQAGQALQRAKDALTTQPVDTAALRAAARDVAAVLGNAAAVCAPSSSTAPTGTSETESETETGTGTDTTAPTS